MMMFWVWVLLVGLVRCTSVQLPTTVERMSDGDTTLISLSTYNESNKQDQAFTVLTNIEANANFIVRVDHIPAAVTFIVIQAHAHLYNVSMSYDQVSSRTPGKFVIGTNVGLFVETNGVSFAQVYVTNKNSLKIDALLAVVAYTNDAPYPGGCNMEFDIERSSFQKLVYDRATVTVDAQPAAVPKIGAFEPLCEKYPLRHEAYRVYMPEQDFTNQTYFLAIASMLTVRDTTNNANLIPASLFGSPMRRVYSVYPGTGSVFGMIAHFANYSSAYVPIVTYGCDVTTSCSSLESTFSRVVCALTFFLGIFVAMRGYDYFKTSMLLVGMLTGGFVGYAMSAPGNASNDDATGAVVIAILTGSITSLVWLLMWMTFSSPIPSLTLSGLALGSFFFYVFYYTIPGELLYLEFDLYFWMLFSTFVLLVILMFSVIPLVGNILCFTALGAYATVFSMDYYSGSNLKYIVINGVRRVAAPNFGVALIQPPYQDRDILLTFFWAFLVILGLYKQCASSSSRAPYPPSASALVASSEGAPILGGRTYQNRYKTFYQHYQQQPNAYERL